MNSELINKIAKQNTPAVSLNIFSNFYRHDILKMVKNKNCIGIELGVAGGDFSKRMVESQIFENFYGVDLYEDHHNVKEYISALKFIGLGNKYNLLRMSFEESLELFEDNYFDFIYFDGYAHTGEEGGKTFSDWYRKLKIGGMFAGDDYHDDWPLVKWAVNDMICQIGCELNITGKTENTNLNKYPSWFFIKDSEKFFVPNEKLKLLGSNIRSSTRNKSDSNVTISITQLENVLRRIKEKNPKIAKNLKKLL
jgi:hypothetical protein